MQSRLLSTLASQITDVIFGDNAQQSGLIRFGDQEISFVRGLDSVTLTIIDARDGHDDCRSSCRCSKTGTP